VLIRDLARINRQLQSDGAMLNSHRGWGTGSAELARALAGHVDAPLPEG